MKFYTKRPIPVAAVKVDKENENEIIELLNSGTTGWKAIKNIENEEIIGFMVYSWEGAEPTYYGTNYWIIRGVKGECYPCEGTVFEESYEEVK